MQQRLQAAFVADIGDQLFGEVGMVEIKGQHPLYGDPAHMLTLTVIFPMFNAT
jgi:hypothetical protein